jgi:hypothetical protein
MKKHHPKAVGGQECNAFPKEVESIEKLIRKKLKMISKIGKFITTSLNGILKLVMNFTNSIIF